MSTLLQVKSEKTQFRDRRLYLKIKLKSLAAEARIIRHEERKGFLYAELRDHRIMVVRKEARHTLLAYGFLRGRTRAQIETSKKPVDWAKVESMVKKYGAVFGGSFAECKAENDRVSSRFQSWKLT